MGRQSVGSKRRLLLQAGWWVAETGHNHRIADRLCEDGREGGVDLLRTSSIAAGMGKVRLSLPGGGFG